MPRDLGPKKREENEIEFSRIVAFSDGVFSIAITLLVLELKLPEHLADGEIWRALRDQHEQFLAYAISFAVIARFWLVHHGFFSEVKAFNSRLIGLNMFYLAFIVLIPFSSQVLGEYGGTLPAVVVYSVNLAAVVLIGQGMAWDARRNGLATSDAETEREGLLRAAFISGVFLLSIVVALFDPSIAPYMWLALFFEGRGHVIERLSRRAS
jgi:uncharacterized membrane protein